MAEAGGAGAGLPADVGLLTVTGGLEGTGLASIGPCLFVFVTALDSQGQRGGVPGAGLADLACGQERLTKTVECFGLTRAIVGLAMEGQRLLEMADRLPMAAPPQVGDAQESQRAGLAQPAADLAAQPHGPPKMADGLLVTALPQLEFAEVAQHKGLARPYARVTEERQ